MGEERQVEQVGVASMGRFRLRVALFILLAAAIAACGAGEPRAVPSVVTGAPPTTMPDPTGGATGTITVEAGVDADGPGGSISHALANAGIGAQLVNGILLREVDGTVWLCEDLLTSSPPQCAEPRLLVENRAQEDQTFVNDAGLHEADGVRWIENMQVFGIVRR